jgi:hypothetical protein
MFPNLCVEPLLKNHKHAIIQTVEARTEWVYRPQISCRFGRNIHWTTLYGRTVQDTTYKSERSLFKSWVNYVSNLGSIVYAKKMLLNLFVPG